MSILAKDTVAKVGIRLNDSGYINWTQSELLKWLNAGQRAIALVRPDASVSTLSFVLVAGTKQAIPNTAIRMIALTRNMGADGATPGDVIRIVTRDVMDRTRPDWHTGTTVAASATVERFIYDGRVPKVFWVFPPQPALNQGYVEGQFSTEPADCTINGVDGALVDTNLSIDDAYEGALMEYMLYLAFDKETDTRNPAKASDHKNTFFGMLGIQMKSDIAFDPKSDQVPVTPFNNG